MNSRFFSITAVISALGIWMGFAAALSAQISPEESSLRRQWNIPDDAKQVLIFAQSSHVDPDWLFTSDQYQKLLTDKTFDRAIEELGKDPRYVYSVECIFFFKRYWDGHPDQRGLLRDYVNQGRVKFTGTGVTSPDTLLPEGENLIRDYLFGFEWLKKQGMNTDPKAAYFADSFGHSPTVPAILRELGYKYTAFTRIDGSYFTGIDTRPEKDYPLPGSDTELLLSKLKTNDFIWRSGDGSEVIAHLNAFSYGQGDLVDKAGAAYLYGLLLGAPARSPKQTDAKIDSYIKQLRPLSKTGYMFCPIGGDFNPPVLNLLKILDHYNQVRYPQTKVFVALAGLEDYFRLVEFHRDQLPVITMDPNPTYMGFYSSRPELKQRCRNLSQSLLAAEALGVKAILQGKPELYPDLSRPWEISLFSDHHDFITGTAPDRVYWKEQIPALIQAQEIVEKNILDELKIFPKAAAGMAGPLPHLEWAQDGAVIKVENAFYRIEIDPDQGGCITRWYDKKQNREILSGPSNDLVLYQENGGLWRMGQELSGGKFQQIARAGDQKAEITVKEGQNLVITVSSILEGREFKRSLYFQPDQPMVRMKVEGSVNKKRTATVVFRTLVRPGKFIQELPYGIIERPLNKLYQPTFWAVKNWVDLVDASGQFGVNLALTAPAAVHAGPDGILEAITLRWAPQEKVKGMPLILSFPAKGSDPDRHEFDYAFWPHNQDSWLKQGVFRQSRDLFLFNQTISSEGVPGQFRYFLLSLFDLFKIDRSDVLVTAQKQAESHNGVIVRLFRYNPEPVTVHLGLTDNKIQQAFLTDGLERELKPLLIKDGKVELEMPYSLATVLLVFEK